MKQNAMTTGMGWYLNCLLKSGGISGTERREVGKEYRNILDRAKDIGSGNTLLSSYGLCAFFLAMTRKTTLSPEECRDLLDEKMRNSRLLKMVLGDAGGYFSEAHMKKRREWSKKTHEKKYENDWVVDVLEETPDYKFGFNYLECGVCKLCRDEGCPELAKYLCSLDFMLVEVIGIRLTRTRTLAEGGDFCDFRFHEK